MDQLSFLEDVPTTQSVDWVATRQVGLQRLENFLPRAGRTYARTRNFDLGPMDRSNISCLSPWLRHRLILEQEVISATLTRHSLHAAEKFMQEVFWRAYFKGWLEQHPGIWSSYRSELQRLLDLLPSDGQLSARYQTAIEARTGIECFDAWARELVETGYLHNHSRMWFASIWIFTLKLPWQLGADFFYRYLLDGDPASNTLSWRWVGGLHTKGKTYLARSSNISRFTNGRFDPAGQLVAATTPLADDGPAVITALRPTDVLNQALPYGLLITEEDCHPESLDFKSNPVGVMGLAATNQRSPLPVGERAAIFARCAVEDAISRAEAQFEIDRFESSRLEADDWTDQLTEFATASNIKNIVTSYAPAGPVAERLASARPQLAAAGIQLVEIRRAYDEAAWPHATKGFFKLKAKIPKLIEGLNG